MKKGILLLFLISITAINAQNEFLDFIVLNSKDTIYGTFQKDQLYEKNKLTNKIIKHDLDKVIALRKNDVLFQLKEVGYKKQKTILAELFKDSFIALSELNADFILNKNKDSVFGRLKKPLFGSKYINSADNFRIKVDKKATISYRDKNTTYDLKSIDTTILSVEKKVFLKRVIKGDVSLYEFKILRSDVGSVNPETFYILEKNKILHLISNANNKQQLIDFFIKNEPLVDLIDTEFYSLENLYLIVKRYNSEK